MAKNHREEYAEQAKNWLEGIQSANADQLVHLIITTDPYLIDANKNQLKRFSENILDNPKEAWDIIHENDFQPVRHDLLSQALSKDSAVQVFQELAKDFAGRMKLGSIVQMMYRNKDDRKVLLNLVHKLPKETQIKIMEDLSQTRKGYKDTPKSEHDENERGVIKELKEITKALKQAIHKDSQNDQQNVVEIPKAQHQL